MVIILIVIFIVNQHFVVGACPILCDQKSCSSGVLLCSESGLSVIPEIPSSGITNVIITNQLFPKPFLTYKNLSRYGPEEIHLKEMTLQNCGISDIESESFSHLIHLTSLDLSHNNLSTIRPRSFKALNLKTLNLNGNRFLELIKDSFNGLVVNSLSLANCDLSELHFESIREIAGHLTKLILTGNKLKTLSPQFILLFRRLEELRLDDNKFKCDCHLRWIVAILTKTPTEPTTIDRSATCSTPFSLKGKLISTLPESVFECLIPSLKKININIIAPRVASLSCLATAQSDARVYWHQPNGSNVTHSVTDSEGKASINVRGSASSDKYSCYAVNDNGKVTVDLSIHWPPTPVNTTNKLMTSLVRFINISEDANIRYLFIRQFSLLEMLLSIATTFIITIVLFSLIYYLLAKKLNFAKENNFTSRSAYDGGVYSDIPVYDVPQMPSPRHPYHSSPSSIQSTHLIDFKTQRFIPSNYR